MAFDPTATRSGSEFSTNPFYQGAWLCYINGIAVPIQGFSVTHGVWMIPSFTIDLVPDETLMRLGHEDLAQVALFYLDQWADPDRPEWRLLADGEIVGWSYRQTPGGRVMSFKCMSHIRTLQQLYFFYMTNVEDVVASKDPALQASGFATEGLSYPYALFHKGLRLTGAEATALNGGGTDAAAATAGNSDAIKAPFEFVYNVIRGVISKEVPDEKRSLPMMNFFARHIRTSRMHNRFVRQPLLEDAATLAERKGVFPIFEAARNEQALLAMQRHTASQLSNSGSVYSIVEQVLRLVYMELSMIPNPACVQVDLAKDGEIIAGVSDSTPTQDVRASRPLDIPTAAQDTGTTRRDREVARLAVQLGREPTGGDLAVNGLAGTFSVGSGAFSNIDLGNPAEVLGHYRETLRRRGVQPAALVDEMDPSIATETRNIDTYDISIAREVARTGRLPQSAPEGGVGYSAGMIDHYRETVRLTGMTPQSIAELSAGAGATSGAAQAPTRLSIAVNQERERVINARRNAEAQAAREAEDARQRRPYQEGVPPTAPLRLAQYAVKPQFLFSVPPACNVIYPSMEDGWTLDEDYTAQPTRIYVNDSAYTRLLRAQGANRDFMLHALTVAYPEEANAVMHHRIVGPNGMANSGAHETGKDMLIWPEEYFAGPKVARMALSPWFQTMMQWKNANAAGSTGPAATPVAVAAPTNRAVALASTSTSPNSSPTGGSIQTSDGQFVSIVSVPSQRAVSLIDGRAQGPGEGTSFGGRGTRSNITGLSGYQFHAGDDYLAAVGLPVMAALGGRVVSAMRNFEPGTTFYGNMVVIHHGQQGATTDAPNGVATVYAHLSSLAPGLRAGQTVSAGQVIGYVGATAGSPTESDGYAVAYGVDAAGVQAARASTRNNVSTVLGVRRITSEGVRRRLEASRLRERYGDPSQWPADVKKQKMYLNIPDVMPVQVARAIGGFFRDDPPHLHFEVLRQSASGARPVPVRIDRASRTVLADPMRRLTPKAWLEALGISVGAGSAPGRRGRIGVMASGVPGAASLATVGHTDESISSTGDRTVTEPAVIRTVTRPTGDGARAATATPGVLNTPGQAIDVSTVPREVVAAGLEPENEFQKLFYLYAQYEFFRQRYEARACGASLRFNPYILAGFPAVLFDTQKTGFHTFAYVQQVTHSASVGPMGSMSTTVQFIATRMLPEFFADVRRDSELFARRVDSAPAEMIPEIRETLQVKEQAELYYQRLLYGYREPTNGEPAAFDIKRAVGYQTEAGDVEPIVIEETARTHYAADNAAAATAPVRSVIAHPVSPEDIQAAQNALDSATHANAAAFSAREAARRSLERSSLGETLGTLFQSDSAEAYQRATDHWIQTERERERLRDALAELRRRADTADPYSSPVVQATTTTVSHNIDPNREVAPMPGVYSKAFEEYHTAMRLSSRPVCTLNDYIRFWHGGETVGALLETRAERPAQVEGEVTTFAYASVVGRDVNTTGGPNGPATTQAVRNTATYYRRIYRLRQGPGPAPSPAERGYTDPPFNPSSESAGVAANYPETRTDWDAVLIAYADKIRNIQFER